MEILEKIINWLKTYPLWGEGGICVDHLDPEPGSAGLYQKGLQEKKRTEDVQGNVITHCRYRFLLRRMAQDKEQWLPDFQQWVQDQCAQRLIPHLGDEPVRERIQAVDGKLVEASQPGTGVYEVALVVDLIKNYQEEKYGKD